MATTKACFFYVAPLVVPMAISQEPCSLLPLVPSSWSRLTAAARSAWKRRWSRCTHAVLTSSAVAAWRLRCSTTSAVRCAALPEHAPSSPPVRHLRPVGSAQACASLASVSSGGRFVRCADRSGSRRDSRVDLATKTPRDDEVGARAFGVECQQEVVSRGEGATLRAEGAALTGTVRR